MKMITIGAVYVMGIIVTVGASPVPNSPISPSTIQVTELALSSCDDGLAVAGSPSLNMIAIANTLAQSHTTQNEVISLSNLQTCIFQLKDSANLLVTQNKQWLSLLENRLTLLVRNSIHLQFVQHSGVTAETNSRLYTLMQLAVYANFLKGQETDADYGPAVKQALLALRTKLTEAVCTLKGLVLFDPLMSNKIIKDSISTDYINPVVSLFGESPAVKRAFTMVAVKIMAQTLSSIEVVDTKSVTLRNV